MQLDVSPPIDLGRTELSAGPLGGKTTNGHPRGCPSRPAAAHAARGRSGVAHTTRTPSASSPLPAGADLELDLLTLLEGL